MLERTTRPSNTAAEVSSQLVSMPKMVRTRELYCVQLLPLTQFPVR